MPVATWSKESSWVGAPTTKSPLTSTAPGSVRVTGRAPLVPAKKRPFPGSDGQEGSHRRPDDSRPLKQSDNEKDAKIATLESALAHSQRDQTELRAKLIASELSLMTCQSKLAASQVPSLEKALAASNSEVSRLNGDLKRTRAELISIKTTKDKARDGAQDREIQIFSLQAKVLGLENENTELRAMHAELERKNQSGVEKAARFNLHEAALREAQNERVLIGRELAASRKELKEIREKQTESRVQNDRYKAEIEDLRRVGGLRPKDVEDLIDCKEKEVRAIMKEFRGAMRKLGEKGVEMKESNATVGVKKEVDA